MTADSNGRHPSTQGKPSGPILQTKALEFSYGKMQVLFGVSVEVGQGEALALLGTNGAGKSTLLDWNVQARVRCSLAVRMFQGLKPKSSSGEVWCSSPAGARSSQT